ncbi:hypothetical protein VitviT2T_005202 [Vitis vinifera]|uniref:Uncharacterized protein n=1 Tax=Vitis vinifera TaxID=29760 RepID=A0ABY9BSA9_VITVI|nr:hypothetical protein VitviT2T_005202 [Vitis vinifera]
MNKDSPSPPMVNVVASPLAEYPPRPPSHPIIVHGSFDIFGISIFWNFDTFISHLLLQLLGILTADRAADRHANAKDILHCIGRIFGHGSWAHGLSDHNNVEKGVDVKRR